MWNGFVSCISLLFLDDLSILHGSRRNPTSTSQNPSIPIPVYLARSSGFQMHFHKLQTHWQQMTAVWFKGMTPTASWSAGRKNPGRDNDMPKSVRNSKAAHFSNMQPGMNIMSPFKISGNETYMTKKLAIFHPFIKHFIVLLINCLKCKQQYYIRQNYWTHI